MQIKGAMLPSAQSAASPADLAGPLSAFDLHGHQPSPDLSEDENYMDAVLIITRSSKLRQGSMGCILVKPKHEAEATVNGDSDGEDKHNSQNNDQSQSDYAGSFLSRIIAAAVNTSLFQADDSDVHAEINAIGQVAKHQHARFHLQTHNKCSDVIPTDAIISTEGATAYITMPPCKKCFGALHASGIKRIVSRRQHSDVLLKTAAKVGIEMSCLTSQQFADQRVRTDELFAKHNNNNAVVVALGEDEGKAEDGGKEDILKRRRQRKEEKQARKMAKIAQTNEQSNGN